MKSRWIREQGLEKKLVCLQTAAAAETETVVAGDLQKKT